MTTDRIHRATSDDGTAIAGRVHGDGPPLVLVPGAMSDGEFVWDRLLPWLTNHFQCFAMSTRGRGLSGPSSDLRPERLVEDVTAFVDSIAEPVNLMGWSHGGYVALGATATTAVSATAVYEPAVVSAMSDAVAETFSATISRVGDLAAKGDLETAGRLFMGSLGNDDEMGDAEAMGFFAGWAANVPGFLRELEQSPNSSAPRATEPAELAAITVPLLLMHGTRSIPLEWWLDGVRHVAEHAADSRVREIDGAGHFAPMSEPVAVASELIRFFRAPAVLGPSDNHALSSAARLTDSPTTPATRQAHATPHDKPQGEMS